ncbi:MAG: glycoside hydrolase family 25 protein [Candidatus Nanopelagicales bacterium]
MQKRVLFIGIAVMIFSLTLPVAALEVAPQPLSNVPVKVKALFSHSRIETGKEFTISGSVTPARKGVVVQRERLINGKWVRLKQGSTKTNKKGVWEMMVKAPKKPMTLDYRVLATNVKKSSVVKASVKVVLPRPAPSVVIETRSTPEAVGTTVNLVGTFKDTGREISIVVEMFQQEVWLPIELPVTVGDSAWTAALTLPLEVGEYKYRVVASTSRGIAYSKELAYTVLPASTDLIPAFGPGVAPRIWGIDVARYQHMSDTNGDGTADINDDGLPIDFVKAYAKGLRFVFIKASDGYVARDGTTLASDYALKFASLDRPAAQAAGIFTGLYHFPGMVVTTDDMTKRQKEAAVIEDAREEAIQAADRLAQLGGYTGMDLPYVLDVEPASGLGMGIDDKAPRALVSLWVKTWLTEMKARTGRMPIVYSSPSFLTSRFDDDPFWQDITLWVARYFGRPQISHDAAVKRIVSGGGHPMQDISYSTPWGAGDALRWSFWQYSSMAKGKDFGILNGARLDMNVFSGDSAAFRLLLQGFWQPFPLDYDEIADAVSLTALNTSNPQEYELRINRISNNRPVVSGEISLLVDGVRLKGTRVTYAGVGVWKVSLPEFEIGSFTSIQVQFTDSFGFYAPATLAFVHTQQALPTPSPTPTS